MGVRNKQRRRAKAKRRAEHARRQASRSWARDDHAHASDRGDSTSPRRVREALWAAAGMHRERSACTQVDADVLVSADFGFVAAEAEEQLLWLVGDAWQHGWQPSELARHARRQDSRLARIVAALIHADDRRRDPSTVHPRWSEQVDAVVDEDLAAGWLHDLVDSETSDHVQRLSLVISAMAFLASLGTLPTILPPPGSDPTRWSRSDGATITGDPVLAKVRALLAQAESTTFEAEAEAFTAKAQELMARHAIDAALLWADTGRGDRPVTIRLPIDDPYTDQKSHLLHVVAKHSRCKAVMHSGYGLQSVVGFATDIAATEVLFTSLLVQSHAAMLAEAANAPPGSRTRGRAFRSSFLFAYVCRIDERLAEINESVEATVAAEPSASSLLPVLAARNDAIDEEIAATFGELRWTRSRGGASDALGWRRGELAADRAQLNPSLPS